MKDQLQNHTLNAFLAMFRARGERQDDSTHQNAAHVAAFYRDLFKRSRVNK
jgi:hypothetical protein